MLIEEIEGTTEPAQVVAQTRLKHFVDERAMHHAHFPCDWLRAELEVPLKRASHDLAPTVYKYMTPETSK